jgi:hypothetical protein
VTARLDIEEIRAALTARRVLDYYQHPTKRGGRDELESSACPRRADHSRRAFTINVDTGLWRCYPCAIAGDAIRLVAEFERLTDFPAVLVRCAEIAGVAAIDLSDHERQRRRDAWRAARQQAEAEARARRKNLELAAVPLATAYWRALAAADARGAEYLAERGLAAAAPMVRYDLRAQGSPAIPLYTSLGSVRNVVRRRLPELGEPKTPGLRDCPTAGTLLGRLGDIRRGGVAVLTEGVADTITSVLAWPGAIPLGAHGACNLPAVAKAAARRCVEVDARMVLCPHDDRTGHDAALDAVRAAVSAGLSVQRGTLVIVKHGAKDLNDAWRGGWRPTA